jgi:Mg2+/Co2+ transporter CorC
VVGAHFSKGDWVSVGGLVTGLTGRIAEPGSEIIDAGYCIRVMKSDSKRVYRVEVEQLQ